MVKKNQYRGKDCLKRVGLGQFADLRGGAGFGKKEEGGVFERGLYPNANYEQQFFLIYFITTFLKQYSHILK